MRIHMMIIAAIVLLLLIGINAPPVFAAEPYCVLIGATPEDLEELPPFQTVVVDAAYFAKDDIDRLHKKGSKVYSYFNVGSIETFRDAYPEFKDMTLGVYDNWPGEFWMDVTHPEWRRYLEAAAKDLAEKGIDGFFIDNADVYYQYPNPEILNGLTAIINGLGQYEKDIVINGGDTFVSKAVLDAEAPLVSITGVNQECVFTAIDFDNSDLTNQDAEAKAYYLDYLSRCQEAGIAVYLTEYAPADAEDIRREVADYCGETGYIYYIASSIELDTW